MTKTLQPAPGPGGNPRFANYARAHGRASEEQLLHDRKEFPSGCMTGYIMWNNDRLRYASAAIPEAFFMGRLIDGDAYDAWLTAHVDRIPTEMSHRVEPVDFEGGPDVVEPTERGP